MENSIDVFKVRYCTVPHCTDDLMVNYLWIPEPVYRITCTMLDYSKITYFGTHENLRAIWLSCQRNETVFEGTKVSCTSFETEGKSGTYTVYT